MTQRWKNYIKNLEQKKFNKFTLTVSYDCCFLKMIHILNLNLSFSCVSIIILIEKVVFDASNISGHLSVQWGEAVLLPLLL